VNRKGYVYLKTTAGWRAEHRVVIERTLGRTLGSREHVHHLDGDTGNNDPQNLVVMTFRDHMAHHGIFLGTGPGRAPKRCKDCGKTGRKKIKRGRCAPCQKNVDDRLFRAHMERVFKLEGR